MEFEGLLQRAAKLGRRWELMLGRTKFEKEIRWFRAVGSALGSGLESIGPNVLRGGVLVGGVLVGVAMPTEAAGKRGEEPFVVVHVKSVNVVVRYPC